MPLPIASLGILGKLSPKQWGLLIGALAVIGILLGSHFAVYKWGKAKAEAQAYAVNLKLEQQVRTLESQLKVSSDQNLKDWIILKERHESELGTLQEKLEDALNRRQKQNVCTRTFNPTDPDPAIGVWNEAINIEGLPPAPDEPFIIDGGNPAP